MNSLYFMDTEFAEDGKTIDLISIGIVADDGREYYAASLEADLSKANEWVTKNVVPHLPPSGDPAWKTRAVIRDEIFAFMTAAEFPQVWGFFSA